MCSVCGRAAIIAHAAPVLVDDYVPPLIHRRRLVRRMTSSMTTNGSSNGVSAIAGETLRLVLAPPPDAITLASFVSALVYQASMLSVDVTGSTDTAVELSACTRDMVDFAAGLLNISSPRVASLEALNGHIFKLSLEPLLLPALPRSAAAAVHENAEPPAAPPRPGLSIAGDVDRLVSATAGFGPALGATVEALREAMARLTNTFGIDFDDPEPAPAARRPATPALLPPAPAANDSVSPVGVGTTEAPTATQFGPDDEQTSGLGGTEVALDSPMGGALFGDPAMFQPFTDGMASLVAAFQPAFGVPAAAAATGVDPTVPSSQLRVTDPAALAAPSTPEVSVTPPAGELVPNEADVPSGPLRAKQPATGSMAVQLDQTADENTQADIASPEGRDGPASSTLPDQAVREKAEPVAAAPYQETYVSYRRGGAVEPSAVHNVNHSFFSPLPVPTPRPARRSAWTRVLVTGGGLAAAVTLLVTAGLMLSQRAETPPQPAAPAGSPTAVVTAGADTFESGQAPNPAPSSTPATRTSVPVSTNAIRYQAKAGESLEAIARYFGAQVADIVLVNDLPNSSYVTTARELIIPQP